MALGLGVVGTEIVDSGSCKGVGGFEEDRFRPWRPSGDDFSETFEGVVDDGIVGLRDTADFMTATCDENSCCAGELGAWNIGDCPIPFPLPLARLGGVLMEEDMF